MSSGGQQPSAPQTPFSPNYRERRSVQSRGPGNAYTQRPGQQPNPQQPAQQLPPPPQQGNMQYDGGGYSTPFGGYGGFFEQYRTPFSGYGGGYGGGFSQPFALPQNPYQPPAPPPTQFGVFNGFGVAGGDNGFRNSPQQPPPGMEVNPNYQPSNRLSQDVRPSDMQFRPIQARTGTDQPPPGFELNPEYRELPPGTIRSFGPDSIRYRPIQGSASPEPAPSSYGSTEKYKAIPDSPLNLQLQDLMRRLSENPSSAFGFAERLGGSPQGARPNPATGVMPSEPISDPNELKFSTQALIRSTKDGVSGYYTDGSMSRFVPDEPQAQQGVGFGNPYGGYGAPYGGSPYMGMFGGLGSLFGGNGFQGMNQQAQAQAQAQQAALQNQRQFPQGTFDYRSYIG